MTREECAQAHYEKFERAIGLPTAEARTLFKAMTELAWQEGYTAGVRETGAAMAKAIETAPVMAPFQPTITC